MTLPINQIICGDCIDIMKEFPDNSVDLVVTDPPYGIGICNSLVFGGAGICKNNNYKIRNWDNKPLQSYQFNEIARISRNQILFGANYYSNILPQSNLWIVWDKQTGKNNFADAELIYTSFDGAIRIFRYVWRGLFQEKMGKHKEERVHPTQKPLPLMKWIINKFSDPDDIILDPFCGSGTTCVAAKMLGRRYIGIDFVQDYCDIAQQRLDGVNLDLFIDIFTSK